MIKEKLIAFLKFVFNKRTITRLIFIIIAFASVFLIRSLLPKQSVVPTEKVKEQEESRPREMTESESIVWELFLEEGKKTGYIDESNLESIIVHSIDDYGRYTKSNPHLRYEQLSFTYTCKDKTTNCVKVNPKGESQEYYSQLVTIDLRDQTYIKIGGLSFGMDEEFVKVTRPFTYYDLEG